MKIFDVRSKESRESMKMKMKKGWVLGVKFSEKGERLITCGNDKTVTVWDWRKQEPLYEFVGHRSSVLSIEARGFSEEGRVCE